MLKLSEAAHDPLIRASWQGEAPGVTVWLIRVDELHIGDCKAVTGLESCFLGPISVTMFALESGS